MGATSNVITDAYAHFHLRKRPDGKIWIEYVIDVDPGGSLPTWLVMWSRARL